MRAILATIDDLKSGAVSNIPHWKFIPDQNMESLGHWCYEEIERKYTGAKAKNLMH